MRDRNEGFLSSGSILAAIESGRLVIDPLDPALIRPAGICLRLGSSYIAPSYVGPIDVADPSTYPVCHSNHLREGEALEVPAHGMVLANTLERIALPADLVGWIGNISGLARLGVQAVLSSFVSPGFGEHCASTLTLEIVNAADVSVRLHPGQRICHLVLARLSSPSDRGYDTQVGTYARQVDPRGSMLFKDFET